MSVITPKNAGEIGWTTSPESFGSEFFVKNLKRNNLIVEVETNPKQDLLIQFNSGLWVWPWIKAKPWKPKFRSLGFLRYYLWLCFRTCIGDKSATHLLIGIVINGFLHSEKYDPWRFGRNVFSPLSFVDHDQFDQNDFFATCLSERKKTSENLPKKILPSWCKSNWKSFHPSRGTKRIPPKNQIPWENNTGSPKNISSFTQVSVCHSPSHILWLWIPHKAIEDRVAPGCGIHLVAKNHIDFHLIGGFNSIEKYSSNWIISPEIGVKIKNLDFPEMAGVPFPFLKATWNWGQKLVWGRELIWLQTHRKGSSRLVQFGIMWGTVKF